MELAQAYPGRLWKRREFVNHCTKGRPLEGKDKRAAQQAVWRALDALKESGFLEQIKGGRPYDTQYRKVTT
jgi:hypothetical protein